ncbi:LysR family transcriptional regulator [Peptoniphilus sp. SGI.035]|uniref:LysR family transcriptional regulator n=1 Tax=Peptoniphilus sp. SGI.035 TaxID=3420564 RepID=UPI003D00B9BE
MNFLSLYYFVELSKDLHFTKTSERLFISQQTLSNNIKSLESYYNIKLINRKPKVTLTYAGEKLLAFAKELLIKNRDLEDMFSDINEDLSGSLKFGASISRATISLPKIFPVFTQKYPNVQINYIDDISKNLEPLIVNNELDFAIVISERPGLKIKSLKLMDDQIYLCVTDKLLKEYYPNDFEKIKEKSKNGAYVEDFKLLPFSMLSNRLGNRIESFFIEKNLEPKINFSSTYSQLILPFCSKSLSACFVSHATLICLKEDVTSDMNIFPLFHNGVAVRRPISLITQKERYMNSYSRFFQSLIIEHFNNIKNINLHDYLFEK